MCLFDRLQIYVSSVQRLVDRYKDERMLVYQLLYRTCRFPRIQETNSLGPVSEPVSDVL